MSKQTYLDVAEVIDAYRVFPRIYLGVFLFILWDVHIFLKTVLPPESAQMYGNMVWGAVGAMTGFYVATGRKWLG
jgi:hypothetical protein